MNCKAIRIECNKHATQPVLVSIPNIANNYPVFPGSSKFFAGQITDIQLSSTDGRIVVLKE